MTKSFCLFALIVGTADLCADEPPNSACRNPRAGCPAFAGYRAEVEVSSGGVTRHGLIIVTSDGVVHIEHLDEQASRWVHGVVRPQQHPWQNTSWANASRFVVSCIGKPPRAWRPL